jgi:CBS domain-containing protein
MTPNNASASSRRTWIKALEATAPFNILPAVELERLSALATHVLRPAGTLVAKQGNTPISHILVVLHGSIELFFDREGEKTLISRVRPGEIFGGISILRNAGVAVRTARLEAPTEWLTLPADVFLEIVNAYPDFKKYFDELFEQRRQDDSYLSILVAGEARKFLAQIVPFSFLGESDLDLAINSLSLARYSAGTVIFIQGQARVEHLFIVHRGAVEIYFQQEKEMMMQGMLGEGDSYGGISMLMNDSLSIRSLRAKEDTYFFAIPKQIFLSLCNRCPAFMDFFTDTFGKRMLDRSYAEIVAKRIIPRDETLHIFNLSVASMMHRGPIACNQEISIRDAAAIMRRNGSSSIFIQNEAGEFVGILTDSDLRNRVIASNRPSQHPVSAIMTTPLVTIPATSPAFEALITMMQNNLKHLAVTDTSGLVIGAITNHDLLSAQGQSPLFIVREINAATTREEILRKQLQVPGLIHGLILNGAKAENVTRLIATIADAVLDKLIRFALHELGSPPVKFAFMIMGSEGRREQTLKTDQDNAIIFEDVPESRQDVVYGYFLELGNKVCTWLDETGYRFCKGGVMAKNPDWCQPISVWKEKFYGWIHAAEPKDLFHSSIFFDFRTGWGEIELVAELRRFLFDALSGWVGFFRHLTENALHFKPPLGFFRNFVVESKGEHRNTFDIKKAMVPIVDFARIHALKHHIEETNTLMRLRQLNQIGVLKNDEFTDIENTYNFLMELRFVRQLTALIEENASPDNHINPSKLSRMEQTLLKEAFRRIENFQVKMSFEFTGM